MVYVLKHNSICRHGWFCALSCGWPDIATSLSCCEVSQQSSSESAIHYTAASHLLWIQLSEHGEGIQGSGSRQDVFKHHFRPLLLLLDGHASHYNPRVLKIAAEEDIILFCLPPHTTHLLQPLDNGVFSSLKSHWREECQRFYAQNPGKVLNRRNFMAWVQGMMISNVIGCFRATGVYPIDRRVPLSHLSEETNSVSTRSASTPYVPFCTPRKEGATDDRPACTELPQPPTFTVDEVEQFQARFLESTDSRYALWLEHSTLNHMPKQDQGF